MRVQVHYVDAFTDTLFKGNPAAVIVTDEWLPDALMQLIAIENNLSETAFAKKLARNAYHLRWFSPITEIDFCGHATLATAHVLFEQDCYVEQLSFFAVAVGEMTVTKTPEETIQMSFPSREPVPVVTIPEDLIKGLSIMPSEVKISQQAYFAIYENEEDVLTVATDSERLKKLAPYDVVVTSTAKNYDFISRYFWPANGGDEDPVTGSIHAGLAPLWAEKLGKNQLTAYQASDRGGLLYCKVEGERVLISGNAVQYMEGYINI